MFEGLVSSLLKTYIGKYVNVNQDKLSIGLLSGVVELENASLRLDAINDDNRFPFVVKFGHIGKIKLSISWNALRQSPWSLIAENIYIIIGPKRECNKQQQQEQREQQQQDPASNDQKHLEQNGEQRIDSSSSSVPTTSSDQAVESSNTDKSSLLSTYENKWFREVETLGVTNNSSSSLNDNNTGDDPYGSQPRLQVYSYLASFAYSLLNNLHVSLNDLHIR